MARSLRGNLLIASRKLRDPNFFRTVVLLAAHDDEGAMGVVLNQPTQVTVASALDALADLPETGELVGIGGPVERKALFIIHNAVDLGDPQAQIIEGVHLGAGPDDFETIVRRSASGETLLRYRIFFGCAGWGPGQLEGEISRNDWMLLRARHELVVPSEPYALWDKCLAEYQKQHPSVKGAPSDPSVN